MIINKLLEQGCNNEEAVCVVNEILENLNRCDIELECIEDFFGDFNITFDLSELEELFSDFGNLEDKIKEELEEYCMSFGLCIHCGCNSFVESIINQSIICENCGRIRE